MTAKDPNERTLRVGHVSDLHIFRKGRLQPWRYLGNRALGGLNLVLKRGKTHDNDVVVAAFKRLKQLDVDHIVVTGDLSNLAIEEEFQAAREIIEAHAGGPDKVSIIPGNHDYYTFGAAIQGRFERFFGDWMTSELPLADPKNPYPYVKLLDEHVALLGVNTCIPTPPGLAVGRVGAAQRERIAALLDHPTLKTRFVIAALHHHLDPPRHTNARKELMRRMQDASQVKQALLDGGVNLVIHGHNHQHGFTTLANGRGGQMHICEAGSTSVFHKEDPHFGGKFNVYDLQQKKLNKIETYLHVPGSGFEPWWQASFTQPDMV